MSHIIAAEFCTALVLPVATTPLAKRGVAYEKKWGKALLKSCPPYAKIQISPWFRYDVKEGFTTNSGVCCPDFLIETPSWFAVGEVKLFWTPLAQRKLNDLYIPVVNAALKGKYEIRGLVVCKTLTPESPKPTSFLAKATEADDPLFHWTGDGPVLW